MSLKLSDTRVDEPQIRARLGTTAHFCRVVVLWELYWMDGPKANHAAVLALKPLVDVKQIEKWSGGAIGPSARTPPSVVSVAWGSSPVW